MKPNYEDTISTSCDYKITGFLKKRSQSAAAKLGIRKWDKRWFALDERNFLYGSSPKDYIPRHSFPVKDILEVRVIEESKAKHNKFEFEVLLPDRTLRLRPKSESQRRHWVVALQKVRAVTQGHDSNNGEPDATIVRGKEKRGQKLLQKGQEKKEETITKGWGRGGKKHKSQLREFEAECERVVAARQMEQTSTVPIQNGPRTAQPPTELPKSPVPDLISKAANDQGWWGSAIAGGYIHDHPDFGTTDYANNINSREPSEDSTTDITTATTTTMSSSNGAGGASSSSGSSGRGWIDPGTPVADALLPSSRMGGGDRVWGGGGFVSATATTSSNAGKTTTGANNGGGVIRSSDWSTWDDDQVIDFVTETEHNRLNTDLASPKRKELAGPRTPSPEKHKRSHFERCDEDSTPVTVRGVKPAVVASAVYTNALFEQDDEDDRVEEMPKWGQSSSLRQRFSPPEEQKPKSAQVDDNAWLEEDFDSEDEILV